MKIFQSFLSIVLIAGMVSCGPSKEDLRRIEELQAEKQQVDIRLSIIEKAMKDSADQNVDHLVEAGVGLATCNPVSFVSGYGKLMRESFNQHDMKKEQAKLKSRREQIEIELKKLSR